MIRSGLVVAMVSFVVLANTVAAEDFSLDLQRLEGSANQPSISKEDWSAKKTAFIVCDVWDAHHSINAVNRMEEFLPRMNEVLVEARKRGATIIHAPSDCMLAYEDHPARKRVLTLAHVKPTAPGISEWVMRIPSELGAIYPVDQSDGGEDDDPAAHQAWAAKLEAEGRNPGMPWKAQHPGIEIDSEQDYISDQGGEVWNVLEAKGIENVILVGVHTNMCVLGRPFGLRQMVRQGKRVALMRDLTDCMYDPDQWPHVDHFTGNDLVMAYIEKYVCATVTSDQIIGGEPFRFAGDTREKQALPPLPKRDATKEWAPAPIAPKDLTPEVATLWYRCVVAQGGSGLGLAYQEGFGIQMQAWLDGVPVELSPGTTPLVAATSSNDASADPAWLVVRMDLDETAPRLGVLPALVHIDAEGATNTASRVGWQYRLGDGEHSTMPLPAKFGGSPDMYYEP